MIITDGADDSLSKFINGGNIGTNAIDQNDELKFSFSNTRIRGRKNQKSYVMQSNKSLFQLFRTLFAAAHFIFFPSLFLSFSILLEQINVKDKLVASKKAPQRGDLFITRRRSALGC